MKLLLIPLLAVLALPTSVYANWFGRDGSYSEANKACKECEDGGFYIKYEDKYFDRINTFSSRYCEDDKATIQILGWEEEVVQKDKVYSVSPSYKQVVKKRFRY